MPVKRKYPNTCFVHPHEHYDRFHKTTYTLKGRSTALSFILTNAPVPVLAMRFIPKTIHTSLPRPHDDKSRQGDRHDD